MTGFICTRVVDGVDGDDGGRHLWNRKHQLYDRQGFRNSMWAISYILDVAVLQNNLNDECGRNGHLF